MKRIKIEPDPSLNEQYPETLASVAQLKTKGKETIKKKVIYPKGNVKNPMTKEDIMKKFRDLCVISIKKKRCEEILQKLFELDQADSILDVVDLLRNP